MDSILEMHIPHSSVSAIDCGPLFAIFGKRVEYLIGLFVSYDSSYRDN